jgi:rod shape-determining protein MreD
MNGAASLRAVAGFVLLVVAHFAVRPLVGGAIPVDFLTVAVLFAVVRVRPGYAALIGFLAGLGIDSLTLDAFGTAALAYTLIGYVASRLKAAFFTEHLGLTAIFIVAAKWCFDVLTLVVRGGVGDAGWWFQVLVWSPLAGLLSACIGLLLLVVARPWFASVVPHRPR